LFDGTICESRYLLNAVDSDSIRLQVRERSALHTLQPLFETFGVQTFAAISRVRLFVANGQSCAQPDRWCSPFTGEPIMTALLSS